MREARPRDAGGFRHCARLLGVVTVAGATASLIANALTIRDRAIHTGEADAVPAIATTSWIGALVCTIVLVGVAIRGDPGAPARRRLTPIGAMNPTTGAPQAR